jgi:hypothetical protein
MLHFAFPKIAGVLIIAFVISGCSAGKSPSAPGGHYPSATPTHTLARVLDSTIAPITNTAYSEPSLTVTHTPTLTNTPVPSKTPTPSFTPTLALPVGLNTPIPRVEPSISPENVADLVEIAKFGSGILYDYYLTNEDKTLVAVFSNAIRLFDAQTLEQTRVFPVSLPEMYKTYPIPYSISKDANTLAVLGDKQIQIWRISDDSLIQTIQFEMNKGVRAWQASGSPLKWVNAPPTLFGKSALDSMYSQSRAGRGPGVREVPGANPLDRFYKIADPSSIKPHPNPEVASQGGLAGTISGGGQIFYRPITSSGNPAIDTFNVPGYTVDWKYHFPPK